MPLPLIVGTVSLAAGLIGAGSSAHGAVKMKDANNMLKSAQKRHQRNLRKLERFNNEANRNMDELGKLELHILNGFEQFSDTIEKIQNRPQFKKYDKENVDLPTYNREELEKVSIGAGVLLGGLGGAALGTAGGFAAAGATTSAVMALGTASTGTAIASLSGAAATNATLAALGGGAIAAGGGGIALGTTVLGGATLGVGLLIGGTIFNLVGGKLSDQAEEAYLQMEEAETLINKICINLFEISQASAVYYHSLENVQKKYSDCFEYVYNTVYIMHKEDWNQFTDWEKKTTQNTVLLVGLLYKMCQLNLVTKDEHKDEVSAANKKGVEVSLKNAEYILKNMA